MCLRVDSCSSDMDHRQALLAAQEHLEHLVGFQKPIPADCLLPFQKIKEVLSTGVKFALWDTAMCQIFFLSNMDAKARVYQHFQMSGKMVLRTHYCNSAFLRISFDNLKANDWLKKKKKKELTLHS